MNDKDEQPRGFVFVERQTSLLADLAASTRASTPTAVGLVCMTQRPCCLETWLRYHHDVCGVLRFYLRVEDTPELAGLLARWAPHVEAVYAPEADTVSARSMH